jgi:NAD-dependent DNA ligase
MIHDFLDKASKAYYEGNPIISDEEFDALASMSAYEKVGAGVDSSELHLYRMYSLQKVHFGEPEIELDDPVKTPKLDGAAISILYVPSNNKLVLYKVLTRGNGVKGLNITNKLRHLLPEFIDGTVPLQINAEVAAPSRIPNARNYAAGALNLKDVEEVKSRELYIFAYEAIGYGETYRENLAFLDSQGFNTVLSPTDQFPKDGFVVRENSNKAYLSAGFTSKHPRAAYALKPKPEAQITTLLSVEWQVGRTGVVSPVAILEPVVIGEATISRATLHNMDYINMLGLEIGCQVEVIRSGEIIPRIVRRV